MTTSSVFCLRCKMTEVKKRLIRYFNIFVCVNGVRARLIREVGEELKGAAT